MEVLPYGESYWDYLPKEIKNEIFVWKRKLFPFSYGGRGLKELVETRESQDISKVRKEFLHFLPDLDLEKCPRYNVFPQKNNALRWPDRRVTFYLNLNQEILLVRFKWGPNGPHLIHGKQIIRASDDLKPYTIKEYLSQEDVKERNYKRMIRISQLTGTSLTAMTWKMTYVSARLAYELLGSKDKIRPKKLRDMRIRLHIILRLSFDVLLQWSDENVRDRIDYEASRGCG
jgi:hypothetical protein